MCSVAEAGTREDIEGEVGEVVAVRCFPACTRRMEAGGAEVRRERSWRRVGRGVSEGRVRGIAGGYVN